MKTVGEFSDITSQGHCYWSQEGLHSTANDPQTAIDPQNGPQMIVDPKISPLSTANDRWRLFENHIITFLKLPR